MAEVTGELLYEPLKDIRGELGDLKVGQRRIESRLAATDSYFVGLLQSVSRHESDMISLRQRIERIERRLDLVD